MAKGGYDLRAALADAVKRGDNIAFSESKFDPAKLDANSVLAKEIDYLLKNGYEWNKDATGLIKTVK